jgi:hypothetical protein
MIDCQVNIQVTVLAFNHEDMVSLSKYGVAYWRTLFTECGVVVVLAVAASGLDWALSFAPTLHSITCICLSLFEIVESLTRSSYLETCLVIPWALASYHVNCLLSTKAFITVQLGRKFLFWACSSTARLYIFLDGPGEQISLEWTFDILRATAHLLTVALRLRGRKYLPIARRYFRTALGVSEAYGPLALAAFVGLSGIFSVWCFIQRKDPLAELIRMWYELSILQKRWLEMRTKAFHCLKHRLRDYFEFQHHEKLLKQGLPPFQYDSLAPDHIRLLKLKRRSLLSGVIEAELESRPLHEANSQFEALSYRWDALGPKNLILVNGRPFCVGSNLHSMLHARSMTFGERLVWVDAICINQEDKDEKSKQVRRMKYIYQKSKRTISWLGDSFDTPLAVRMIRKIVERWEMFDQFPDEVFTTYLLKTRHPEWRALSRLIGNSYFSRVWIFQELMLGNDLQFYVGGHYLSFEYMNKALSALNRGGENTNSLLRGRLLFCPGAGGLQWDDEGKPNEEKPEALTGIWPYWSLVYLRRQYGAAYALPLIYLLSKSAAVLNASDARDRVYGMLGVADGPVASVIDGKLDYTKSLEELWKEVAVAHFQQLKEGNQSAATEDVPLLLAHAGIGFDGRSNSLPSWVPDWNGKSSMRGILNWVEPSRMEFEEIFKRASERVKVKFIDPEKRNYSAGGKNDFIPIVDQERWTLTLDATQADTLDKIGDYFSHDFDTNKLVSWFSQAKMMCESDGTHILNGQGKEEALWRTLIADWAEGEHPAPGVYADWFDIWHNLHVRKVKIEDLVEKLGVTSGYSRSDSETRYSVALVAAISQLSSKYMIRFTTSCKGRRFCITRRRRLALVPPRSLEGDVVCVIRGLHTPFIVRPVRQEASEETDANMASGEGPRERQSSLEGEYHLVGECYVHGIMDGEAIPMELQNLILV